MLELTTTQIAARLGVSERTVQRWIRIEMAALREDFYNLAPQVSELRRTMEQIIADLTALPEQIEQARLTVPLNMEESPPGQAEARLAALERRVSELEQLIQVPMYSSDSLPADERLTAKE